MISTVDARPAGPRRTTTALAVAGPAAAALGIALTAAVPLLPGSEPLTAEDLVDALAVPAAAALGFVLLARHTAVGLGRTLLALALISGTVWLTYGLGDLLAGGDMPTPAARLAHLLGDVLFIPSFALLLLAPLLLLPDGCLPGPRWRPVAWLAGSAVTLSMFALLVDPGPLDDDVPAWGDNPLGIAALGGLTDAATAVSLVALAVALVASMAAFIVRLLRARDVERRQMRWSVVAVGPLVFALLLDDPLPGTVSAVIVFAALFGGIAWALLGPPARGSVTAVEQN